MNATNDTSSSGSTPGAQGMLDVVSSAKPTASAAKDAETIQESRLLRLPPEIRNHIYELVLVRPCGININMYRRPIAQNTFALLSTNRRINNEAAALYYALNSFYVWGVFKWISTVISKENGEALTDVRLLALVGSSVDASIRFLKSQFREFEKYKVKLDRNVLRVPGPMTNSPTTRGPSTYVWYTLSQLEAMLQE